MGFEHTQSAVALIGLEGFRLWPRSRSTPSCTSWWRPPPRSWDVRVAGPGRCPDADCDVATWTERTEAIALVAVIKLVGATNWFIRVRFLDV